MNIKKYLLRCRELLHFKIVRASQVSLLFEKIHLKKFLTTYDIDCVFDVGANKGQYALMLRKFGYSGHIISFEPIPELVTKLRKVAEKDSKWIIVETALDSVSHKVTFNVMHGSQFSSLHDPSHSEINLFKDQNSVVKKIHMRTKTLDDVYELYLKEINFSKPFLKMDTQGNDIKVAEGGIRSLKHFMGIRSLKHFMGIQSELSIKRLYENSTDYRTTIDYYISQGFELSAFVPNNAGHFPRLIEIDAILYNKSLISL